MTSPFSSSRHPAIIRASCASSRERGGFIDQPTTLQIDGRSQIQLALQDADISDIGHPNFIGSANSKLSLYTIRRDD